MRISKRNPIFILVSILTFALAVWMTPVKQPHDLVLENVLVVKYSPWTTLLKFENQDLLGLDEQSTQRVEGAVEAITGRRYENDKTFERFQPALFRSMVNTEGEKRYVLVELAQIAIIPGNSSLRVHVFDTEGFLRITQQFNAGYRTTVKSIRIRETDFTENQLLIVGVEYVMGGHPSTQFYALAGNRMALIYLVQDGRLDSNNYEDSHMTIGPKIERSVDQWEKALGSPDEVEVLSALLWINGHHWEGEPAPYDNDRVEAEKLTALHSRKRVHKRLEELSRSVNYWIKTSAQSVLEKNNK